jgi:hypothetical protein
MSRSTWLVLIVLFFALLTLSIVFQSSDSGDQRDAGRYELLRVDPGWTIPHRLGGPRNSPPLSAALVPR